MANNIIPCKIVMVGDGAVGKRDFLFTYVEKKFPDDFFVRVFESYSENVSVDNQLVSMQLWNTPGQEDYDRLRPLTYPDTNVILLSYRVDFPDSFAHITEKWLPEITNYCPGVPYILVALQKDRREDESVLKDLASKGKSYITTEQGQEFAQKIGASGFFEACSRRLEGVRETVEAALKVGMGRSLSVPRPKDKHGSTKELHVP